MFKFTRTNFINASNFPTYKRDDDVAANGNLVIGSPCAISASDSLIDAPDVSKNTYVVFNIIDKPEIDNTTEYTVDVGEYARLVNLAEHIGNKIEISQDTVYYRNAGTAQVETAVVVGTITTAGDAKVTVTAEGMENSPKDITVAVAESDDASAIAGKIRVVLAADEDVSAFFTVSGSGANVILTAIAKADNDSTMNIAVANDTCAGITEDATSNNTTPGVATVDSNASMWSYIGVGDYLVGSDTLQAAGHSFQWVLATDVSSYKQYLEIVEKTTFGSFTVDADGGTILGGYKCLVKTAL